MADVSDPAEKLPTLLNVYMNFALTEGAIYRGAFLFVRPASVEPPPQQALADDRFFSLFRRTVEQAQQAGVIRQGDPDHITQTLWAGMHGAFALPTNMHRLALDPPEEGMQRMLDALLEWLKPAA